MLRPSRGSLAEAHDLVGLDLDGVVYVGPDAVPGAVEALAEVRRRGPRIAFMTNNAARTPQQVADHLTAIGVDAAAGDVVTSSQAAAGLLEEQLASGASVFVIGGDGLFWALEERGLRGVTDPGDDPAAVVQGYGPEMPWRRVVDGAVLVRSGLPWVATNTDLTLPTARGLGPGNGTLVRLVSEFAGRSPVIAGKPERPLFEEAQRRLGGHTPLLVGDRLDTDIAGANSAGWSALLVMTGVTDVEALVRATPDQRPSYLGADLGALGESAPEVELTEGGTARCGGWSAHPDHDLLDVRGDGSVGDWWRVVASAAWSHLDSTGSPVGTANLSPPPVA